MLIPLWLPSTLAVVVWRLVAILAVTLILGSILSCNTVTGNMVVFLTFSLKINSTESNLSQAGLGYYYYYVTLRVPLPPGAGAHS